MIALDAFVEEHRDAIEFDLIGLGLRLRHLGTDAFTWGDLRVTITQAPRSSALYRDLNPEEAEWGMQEQLLALVADYLAAANWQRSGASKKDYPKQIPRPGVTPDSTKFGKQAISIDDMAAWLGW